MKNPRKILCVIFSIIAVVIIATQSYSLMEARKQLLHAEISEAISKYKYEKTQYIDFSTISTFSWDRMYVFAPYSGCKRIVQALGTITFWPDCKLTGIEIGRNASLLVFTQNKRVIRYVLYEIFLDDISNEVDEEGFGYQEAHFIKDEQGRMVWIDKK